MNIDGKWKARYGVEQQPPFIREEGDADETATIILRERKVTGRDPFGYEYSGEYSLTGENVKAVVVATPYQPDAQPIFDGVTGSFLVSKACTVVRITFR